MRPDCGLIEELRDADDRDDRQGDHHCERRSEEGPTGAPTAGRNQGSVRRDFECVGDDGDLERGEEAGGEAAARKERAERAHARRTRDQAHLQRDGHFGGGQGRRAVVPIGHQRDPVRDEVVVRRRRHRREQSGNAPSAPWVAGHVVLMG